MTNPALLRRTVDDYLGDGKRRFFATGYRQVRHEFGGLHVDVPDGAPATAVTRVAVTSTGTWSTKAAGDLRPHLSTIDAIVLGVQLSEACLTAALGLEPAERRAMRVHRIHLRSGSPQEDLADLPATATLRGSTLNSAAGDPAVLSGVDCEIGSMRTRCEIAHPAGRIRTGRARFASPEAQLGPAADRYYGSGYTRASQQVTDLSVDLAAQTAHGMLVHTPAGAEAGIDGAHQPALTAVEAFAGGLQLAQILLYELDGISRIHSDTLWMRSTVLTSRPVPYRGVEPLTVCLDKAALIEMAGGIWRTADIVAEVAGISFRCAVAHRLPSVHWDPARDNRDKDPR